MMPAGIRAVRNPTCNRPGHNQTPRAIVKLSRLHNGIAIGVYS
jgi:hypothetical protein